MRAGKVIADSDDEDDFSPVPSPLMTLPSSSARSAEGAMSSADPGIFQSAYLAQQDAAARDSRSNGGPLGPTPDGGEVAPRTGADAYDPWALMSSPDELGNTPKGNTTSRQRISKTYSKKRDGLVSSDTSPRDGPGLATPAQNETPSKSLRTYSKKIPSMGDNGTSTKDGRDITESGTKNITPTKAVRTYTRKDLDVNSSATSTHDIIDLVSPDQRSTTLLASKAAKRNVEDADSNYGVISTRPSKRKRISDLRVKGKGDLEEGSDDVSPSFDASPDAGSMAPPTKRNAQDSSKGDYKRLYVETSRMTARQKEQYEEVSFPSLSSVDEPNLRQYTHLARSSGDATIAYPTPTQYRRADPSMPPVQESPSPARSRRGSEREQMSSLPPTAANPGSFPDVISGVQEDGKVVPAVEPLIVEQDNSCDEDWNEEDFGFPRQQELRPSRTKKRSRPPEQEAELPVMEDGIATTAQDTESSEAQDTSIAQQSVEKPPVPKKRGRKKKEKAPESEPEPEPEPAVPAAEDHQPEDAPPQKRKRGRPRKPHKAGARDSVPTAQDAKVPDPDPRSEASHNVGDGSEGAGSRDTAAKEEDEQDSRKDGGTGAKTDGEGDAEGVSPGRRVFAGIGQEAAGSSPSEGGNVSAGRGSATDGKGEFADKGQATPRKPTALQTAGVKPVYRVGLSRRSRIAPLLKSIRKG